VLVVEGGGEAVGICGGLVEALWRRAVKRPVVEISVRSLQGGLVGRTCREGL
jgi:hypothetical protein